MPTCPNGHEIPPGRLFCTVCGHKIDRGVPEGEEDPDEFQKKIREQSEKIVRLDAEIKNLREQLEAVTAERDALVGKPTKSQAILNQIDQKDKALQSAVQGLKDLRASAPQFPPGSKPHLVIESYPIPNPAFGMTFDDHLKSLDLSTTVFRIRATLERHADGSVNVLIHSGATINIKADAKTPWRRFRGGERLTTEVGMILFDPKGAGNLRFDRSS